MLFADAIELWSRFFFAPYLRCVCLSLVARAVWLAVYAGALPVCTAGVDSALSQARLHAVRTVHTRRGGVLCFSRLMTIMSFPYANVTPVSCRERSSVTAVSGDAIPTYDNVLELCVRRSPFALYS